MNDDCCVKIVSLVVNVVICSVKGRWKNSVIAKRVRDNCDWMDVFAEERLLFGQLGMLLVVKSDYWV